MTLTTITARTALLSPPPQRYGQLTPLLPSRPIVVWSPPLESAAPPPPRLIVIWSPLASRTSAIQR
jgi:hypothetical protein